MAEHKFEARQVMRIALASLYFVSCCWSFWERGVYALGFNGSLLILLIFAAFIPEGHDKPLKESVRRAAPFLLIALSFSLYENPYLECISLLITLPLFGVFFAHELANGALERWSFGSLFIGSANVMFSPLHIPAAAREILKSGALRIEASSTQLNLAARVGKGLGLLAALSMFLVIPLLSSADSAFAELIDQALIYLYDFVVWLLSLSLIARLAVFAVLSLLLAALISRCLERAPLFESAETKRDEVAVSIVLGGTLLLYLLFLALQSKQLIVSSLPLNFRETESLVKGGFWQLLALTTLNIALIGYCRSGAKGAVQLLLTAFLSASVLLLLSAGLRMALYVRYYGLSYEKFFAAYTVLYCFAVFGHLARGLFCGCKQHTLRFLFVTFLWMYSIATVLPVERIILHGNLALAQLPGSRLQLSDLRMLSLDVLSAVTPGRQPYADPRWATWKNANLDRLEEKTWYEHSLSSVLNSWAGGKPATGSSSVAARGAADTAEHREPLNQ